MQPRDEHRFADVVHGNSGRLFGGVMVAGVVLAVIVAITARGGDRDAGRSLPADPGVVPAPAPAVAVWYDDAGLHLGDEVEETAVDLVPDGPADGALALVRGGVLYRDPATNDVWFHPWGGDARVVGRHSRTGPSGDPQRDTAAWFERYQLVVYDTARGREISRTDEDSLADNLSLEPTNDDNGFRHVSAEEVVWASAAGLNRLDVITGESTLMEEEGGAGVDDVHDGTRVWAETEGSRLVIGVAGRNVLRVEASGGDAKLSPDGSFVLSPSGEGSSRRAALVRVDSGQAWRLPKHVQAAGSAWSYDDVAMVLHRHRGSERLIACHAVRRACEEFPVEGPVLLPTS